MKKDRLLNDQWGPADARILYPSFWFRPMAQADRHRWQAVWPDTVNVFQRGKLTDYWNKEEMERRGAIMIERWLIPASSRARVWQQYQKQIKAMRVVAARIAKTKLWSKKSLAKAMAEWYQQIYDFWSVSLVPELANFSSPTYFDKAIKKYIPPQSLSEVMEVMLAPTKLSFHQQSELELLRLRGSVKDYKGKLTRYAAKWHWLENSYFQTKNLSASYFADKLKGKSRAGTEKSIKVMENYGWRARTKKAAISRKYNLLPSIRNLADVLAFSIWWQDNRKEVLWWAQKVIDVLSHAICRYHKIKFSDILYYTAEDWLTLALGGKALSAQELKRRKKLFVVYIKGGKCLNYSGAAAKKFLPKQKKQFGNVRIIKGVVASRGQGIIRGRVAILHSPRQAGKMKKGYILVTPMTEPDFVPVMRLASAIITDVGGLMSHAAVVSRELGIPCIVGTKIATRVFKDGDQVEVNANHGWVRKIK